MCLRVFIPQCFMFRQQNGWNEIWITLLRPDGYGICPVEAAANATVPSPSKKASV